MPITISELRGIVTADSSQYDRTLNKVKTDTETAGRSIDSIFNGLGAGFLKAGALMTAAFTAPIVAASEMGREFETQLRRVAANTAMTDDELNKMREVVISIGRDTAAPLSDLAHGFEHAANFGFNAAESAKILDIAMQGAVTTGAKTEEVTNTLAGVLHIFGKSADEAAVTMNTLKEAAGKGNLTLEQFVSVSGKVFATAANLGLNLNEAAGAMSALTRAGFPAAQASTQLVGALNHLVNPTKEIRGEIEHLSKVTGIDLVSDFSQAALQSKGFAAILGDVKRAVGDNTAEALKLFGGLRGGLGVMALIGNASDDYRSILEKLSDTMAGRLTPVQDAYAREVSTLSFALGELKNKFTLLGEELNKSFGATQAGIIHQVGDAIDIVTRGLAAADPEAQKLITTLLGGLAIGGPVLLGLGAIITLLGGPLTVAIVGVTTALTVLFAESVTGANKGNGAMVDFKTALLQVSSAFGTLLDAIGAVSNAVIILVKALAFLMTPLAVLLQLLTGDFKGAWQTFTNAAANGMISIGQSWSNMMADINGRWSNTLNGMVQQGFASANGFGAAGSKAGAAFIQGLQNQTLKVKWGTPAWGMTPGEIAGINAGIEAANKKIVPPKIPAPTVTAPDKGKIKEVLDQTLNMVNDWLSGIDAKLRISDSAWKQLPASIKAALKETEIDFHKNQDAVQVWAATIQAHTGASVTQVNAYLKSLGLNIEFTAAQLATLAKSDNLSAAFKSIGLSAGDADDAVVAFMKALKTTNADAVAALLEQTAAWTKQKTAIDASNAAVALQFAAFGRLHPPVAAHIEDLHMVTAAETAVEKQSTAMLSAIGFVEPWARAAAAIKIHHEEVIALWHEYEDAARKIPESWNIIVKSIFGAQGQITTGMVKITEGLAGFEQVVANLPGKIGDALRNNVGDFQRWFATINGILHTLHQVFDSIPDGLGAALQSLIGFFKQSSQAATNAAETIDSEWARAVGVIDSSNSKVADGVKGTASSVEESSNSIVNSLGMAVSAFSAFMTGHAIGGWKGAAIGAIQGAVTGLMFGPVGAIIGGVAGLLGGLLSGGKSAAQKQQEALQMQQLQQSVQQGAQNIINAAIEGFNKAIEFFNNLDEFTAPRKAKFQEFWKAMGRLMDGFIELAGRWSADSLTKAKAAADAIKPVADAISTLPVALTAIGGYFGVAQSSFDRFFADLDSLMTRFFARSEQWMGDLSEVTHRAKKAANRLSPIVELFGPLIASFKDLSTLQPIADSTFDILDNALNTIVTRMSALSDKFEKSALKAVENFGTKVGPVVDLWKNAVEAFKSMTDIPTPSVADFNAIFNGIEQAVNGMIDLALRVNTDGLDRAEAIATASTTVVGALKAAVESLGSLKDYVKIPAETFAALLADFGQAIQLMLDMNDLSLRFIGIAKTFEANIQDGANHLANAVLIFTNAIKNLGFGLAAFGVTITVPTPTVGTTSFSGGDGFAPSSATGGFAPSAALGSGGGTHYHFGNVTISGDDPKAKAAVKALMDLFGTNSTLAARLAQG